MRTEECACVRQNAGQLVKPVSGGAVARDAAKQMSPEKKASIYDLQFQKKWVDDCDEAEKIMIGKCAFKAYSAVNRVCAIAEIVLAICALVFGIGFLPSLAVCIIWMVNLSVYCKEAMRYAKAGNKGNPAQRKNNQKDEKGV